MEVYYHYTNPQSALSITRTGVIRKSTKKARRLDARHGDGVYLTRVPPTTPKYWIAFNNYDGRSEPAVERMINKGEHCAAVEYLRLFFGFLTLTFFDVVC